MSLFKRKEEVYLREFVTNFYNDNIFNAYINEIDFIEGFCKVIQKNIIEVDSLFEKINLAELRFEIILLRIELFSLAFIHRFGEKLSLEQTVLTRNLLLTENELIWKELESYNYSIAQSSYVKSTSVILDKRRMDLFDKYYAEGFQETCIARMINRLFTEKSWKQNITPFYLVNTFCERLNCKLNEEAQFRLRATIFGLYKGASESMENIKIREVKI